jgi:uncharacterized membrane protein
VRINIPGSPFINARNSMAQQLRHVPATTNGGWGFAAVIVALAVLCASVATYIHKKTYKHPTDVTWNAGASAKEATH